MIDSSVLLDNCDCALRLHGVDCDVLCSYHTDSPDSSDSRHVRLKSCVYPEETVSTCSIFSQPSRSTLSLLQPTKLGKMSSQQLEKQFHESVRRNSNDASKCQRSKKTKASDASKPRYFEQHFRYLLDVSLR